MSRCAWHRGDHGAARPYRTCISTPAHLTVFFPEKVLLVGVEPRWARELVPPGCSLWAIVPRGTRRDKGIDLPCIFACVPRLAWPANLCSCHRHVRSGAAFHCKHSGTEGAKMPLRARQALLRRYQSLHIIRKRSRWTWILISGARAFGTVVAWRAVPWLDC